MWSYACRSVMFNSLASRYFALSPSVWDLMGGKRFTFHICLKFTNVLLRKVVLEQPLQVTSFSWKHVGFLYFTLPLNIIININISLKILMITFKLCCVSNFHAALFLCNKISKIWQMSKVVKIHYYTGNLVLKDDMTLVILVEFGLTCWI